MAEETEVEESHQRRASDHAQVRAALHIPRLVKSREVHADVHVPRARDEGVSA